MARERLDHGFAVFNLHLNKAGKRADEEFKKQFGEQKFNRHILPHHMKGIMSIFERKPNIYTMAWVALVTAFVNEGRRRIVSGAKSDRGEGAA